MPSIEPASGAADEAHPFTDPEGPGALQEDAGEDAAESLLGRETEDDRREGPPRRGSRVTPAIRRARITTATIATSCTRKPTVPAVAGSRRLYSRGERAWTSQWAAVRPTMIRTVTVATRTQLP